MRLMAACPGISTLLLCAPAWAKSRSTVSPTVQGGDAIAEYFWYAMFGLGGLALLFLVVAGGVLAARDMKQKRVMRAIGEPHGLRFNGLVFKRGYGRRAPSYCPQCLGAGRRVVALQEKDFGEFRGRYVCCPDCNGSWSAG